MPIILPNITTNNCNLNLFVCFSMVYTCVKLSLIAMYSLTRLSTVNVYELVRFMISSVVHGGHNITPSAIFLVSRYALFFSIGFLMFRLLLQHFFLHFKFIQLICSGDIEIQPGPIKNSLKFCHWNLNSVLVHDRIKISLLEAYNSVYNYDILVLGETYLSGGISHNETFIEGFSKNPFRKDDPSGLRKGGVCMYFRDEPFNIYQEYQF